MKKLLLIKVNILAVIILLGLASIDAMAAPNATRLGGQDRYDTSIKISQQFTSSESIILASGEDFPDALCASSLAKKLNAPILLTKKDNLNDSTQNEIKRLGAKNIYIIGGTGAISDNVLNAVTAMGLVCSRIGGQDRYETSLLIANNVDSNSNSNGEVALVSGDSYADALSFSSIAASKGIPILLTSSSKLPPKISDFIKSKNITGTYIIGGTGAISDEVLKSTPNPIRLAGADRFETNAEVLNKFADELDWSSLFLATGLDYPDALGLSALASRNARPSPIILMNNNNYNPISYLVMSKSADIFNIYVAGGTNVVSNNAIALLFEDPKGSIIIVLDAGHGGSDPGAVGNSLKEKNVNLAIALKANKLLQDAGYKVILTRSDDTFIDLYERAEIANNSNADLFISFHNNSAASSGANGTIVLYNSSAPNPAKDLAQIMETNIVNTLKTKNLGLQNRPNLVVLNSTVMPAVLLETAFLSNKSDAALISNTANQDKVAQAVLDSVNEYFNFN